MGMLDQAERLAQQNSLQTADATQPQGVTVSPSGPPQVLPAEVAPDLQQQTPDSTEKDTSNVSAEEQQGYEEGMAELSDILYQNQQASDALVAMIDPDDKIGSTAKTVIQLIAQMDEKIDLEQSAIYSITEEAVDRLIELVENDKGMEYSDVEVQQVMMTSWEGILSVFGGDQEMSETFGELSSQLTDQQIKSAQQRYREILNG